MKDIIYKCVENPWWAIGMVVAVWLGVVVAMWLAKWGRAIVLGTMDFIQHIWRAHKCRKIKPMIGQVWKDGLHSSYSIINVFGPEGDRGIGIEFFVGDGIKVNWNCTEREWEKYKKNNLLFCDGAEKQENNNET